MDIHDDDDGLKKNGISRFGNFLGETVQRSGSPLSRRIIAFNLVALSLLVSGILFINQSSDGLSKLRSKNMLTNSNMISNVLANEVERLGLTDVFNAELLDMMNDLAAHGDIDSALYTKNGSRVVRADETIANTAPSINPMPSKTNDASDIFTDAWNRLSSVFATTRVANNEAYIEAFRSSLAIRSITKMDPVASTTTSETGQLIVFLATPIVVNKQVLGAIVISSASGEVDAFINAERDRILKVFALAIVTSILLSTLLANTIGRPLRDLANAAKRGSVQRTGGFNPDRVNIPDMTDRGDEIGDLSGQLRKMTTALYDRIEANEHFTADVTHEIKNPLTSLASAVESMGIVKTDEAKERLLDVIRDDVKRMDRLVTDISNASRLDAELAKNDMEPLDLAQLIRSLVDYHQTQANERQIVLNSILPDGELYILGLENRLAQVFVNLITNAISFVPAGGSVSVTVTRTSSGNAKVMVEDTGCGIPKDNLEDIFKRFYSSRPTQDFGNNSGLGLAISEQIVDAHGGRIWAENIYAGGDETSDPTGARFIVILPI